MSNESGLPGRYSGFVESTIPPYVKPRLSNAQVNQYREQGYLIFNEPVLGASKFERLASCFD